jgi:hypothetical protein
MKTFKPKPYKFPYRILKIQDLAHNVYYFYLKGENIWTFVYVERRNELYEGHLGLSKNKIKSLEEAIDFIYYNYRGKYK